jgi:hypothetical protein
VLLHTRFGEWNLRDTDTLGFEHPEKFMRKRRNFFSDNGLIIVLLALFVICLIGQSLSGVASYNETQATNHLPPIGYWQYLGTGTFLEGLFENWQAAILQLGSLILFGVFLAQRGATHSRKPGRVKKSKATRKRLRRLGAWAYSNSLSIAFFALFILTFIAHLLSGAADYNHERALSHQGPLSVGQFLGSSKFWFVTFQTWEAEYMAIALYIFLSIYLRQEGSPESKPIRARNDVTGKANE